jgi:hypothetical protein
MPRPATVSGWAGADAASLFQVKPAARPAARAVHSVRTVEPDRPGQFRIPGPDPEGAWMTSTQHVRVEGTSYQRGRLDIIL